MKNPSSIGAFVKESLKNFIKMGAVMPSSRYLTRRMTSPTLAKQNPTIVELGAGTGAFTRQLLTQLPPSGRIICIEANEALFNHLQDSIFDKRIEIIHGDALHLKEILHTHGILKADYIISGVPIGNLPRNTAREIVETIKECLDDRGTYLQFQHFLANLTQIKKIFPSVKVDFEPRNIPPAFVLTCKKSKDV